MKKFILMFLFCFSLSIADVFTIKTADDLKKHSSEVPMIVIISLGCDMGEGFVSTITSALEDLQGVNIGVMDANNMYNIVQTDKKLDLGDLILVKNGKVLDASSDGAEPHPSQGNAFAKWVYGTLKKRNLKFTMPEPEPDFLEIVSNGTSVDLESGLKGVYPLTSDLKDVSKKDGSNFKKGTKNKIINQAYYMTGEYGYTMKGEYIDKMYNEGKITFYETPKTGLSVFINVKPEKPKKDAFLKLFTVGSRTADFFVEKKTGKLSVTTGMSCEKCSNGKSLWLTSEYYYPETVELDKWHSFAVSIDYKTARIAVIMNGKRLKDINLGKKAADIYFKDNSSGIETNDGLYLGSSGGLAILKGYARDMVVYDRVLNGKELSELYKKYALNKTNPPAVTENPAVPEKDQEKLNMILWKAAKSGTPQEIETALKDGAEINSRHRGWTSLMYAAKYGKEKNVKILIKNHADPLVELSGWTAQMFAKKHGYDSIVKLLEDHSNTKAFFGRKKITAGKKLLESKSAIPASPED